MDVRQHDHIAVFNSFINGQWGPEIEKRLWYGFTFSLVFTVISPTKILVSMQSAAENIVDWITIEGLDRPNVDFRSMERLHLHCSGSTNCLAIRSLEIGGVLMPTANFKKDKLPHLALKRPGLLLSRSDSHARLFIGVLSAPSNHRRRMAIRDSWFQEPAVLSGEVVTRFFIAQTDDKLEQEQNNAEQAIYGDMEVLGFTDGYYEITKKTKGILEMSVLNTTAQYVLKCDDDSYVFVARLLKELDKIDLKDQPFVYMGYISSSDEPNRDTKSPWFMSKEDFPDNAYPPFAHGPGYILSRRLVEKCLEMWADPDESAHLPLLRLEDISVAVWMDHLVKSHKLPISYRNDDRFMVAGCKENCLVGHYITPHAMNCIWGRYSASKRKICC